MNRPEYNDTDVPYDQDIQDNLVAAGVDERLAHHIAHLFIRDPLLILSERLDQDDSMEAAHFEVCRAFRPSLRVCAQQLTSRLSSQNIQSTNWHSLRFKPPPPNSNLGWRVEFRTMDIQLTDFENAAYSIFLVLLIRASIALDLNLYVPISKVDDNMQRAQARDSCGSGRFFFRKDIFRHRGVPGAKVEDEYEEMTMDEIINGEKKNGKLERERVPGLMSVVKTYLRTLNIDDMTQASLDRYLELISDRASGAMASLRPPLVAVADELLQAKS